MYFHSYNAAGMGVSCGVAGTHFTNSMLFCGNTGSGTYVLGRMIAGNIEMYGTPGIMVDLNSNVAYCIPKASLLQ
jgi:hypothetical protein